MTIAHDSWAHASVILALLTRFKVKSDDRDSKGAGDRPANPYQPTARR